MNAPVLTSDEQALALATKRAVQAAGGLDDCSRETGLSTSQLSRCCSPNHRDSLTVRDAATVEALGHGHPGHPHITSLLARLVGGVFVQLPDVAHDGDGLLQIVMDLATELGDVAGAIRDGLRDGSLSPAERAVAIEQLDDLDRASARLRHGLINHDTAAPPGRST